MENKPDLQSLISLLREFTLQVIENEPDDLIEYAAEYFQSMRLQKQKAVPVVHLCDSDVPDTSSNSRKTRTSSTGSMITEEASLGNFLNSQPQNNPMNRRISVAGEIYKPNEKIVKDAPVYPKNDEELRRIEHAVKDIFVFKYCTPTQLKEVIDAMFERKVSSGEVIICQGDDGDNFYVVDSGIFEVYVNDGPSNKVKIGSFEEKGFFGELALMYNCPRSATVTAKTEGTLWGLDRGTFRKILVETAARKRQIYEDLLEIIPILSNLNAYERMTLADAFESRYFSDGECIIKEGDIADCMYFVEEGKVKIVVIDEKDKHKKADVAYISKGQYFGELALIHNTPRTASVYACGGVTCAVLEVHAFERLLGPCAKIMQRNAQEYDGQRQRLGVKTLSQSLSRDNSTEQKHP